LRVAATASSSAAVYRLRSEPLGKYWRSKPLVFSLLPRCHGLRGSQK
jgi:putative transposase